jgi:hypothetical protein
MPIVGANLRGSGSNHFVESTSFVWLVVGLVAAMLGLGGLGLFCTGFFEDAKTEETDLGEKKKVLATMFYSTKEEGGYPSI